jgi:signal transduction histidine kinase
LEQVRRRIATDLHDDIGSSLTQISILSEVLRQRVDASEVAVAEPLSMIADSSRELVDSMSDIVWAINPQKDYLRDLTQRMRRFASDVFTIREIEFSFDAPTTEVEIGANIRRELFLIFKEAIHNVIKHADCSFVEIVLATRGSELELIVRDDGRGFEPWRSGERRTWACEHSRTSSGDRRLSRNHDGRSRDGCPSERADRVKRQQWTFVIRHRDLSVQIVSRGSKKSKLYVDTSGFSS